MSLTTQVDARVVFLTREIRHHQVREFQLISDAISDFHIMASMPPDPSRRSAAYLADLPIKEQRTLRLPNFASHVAGFGEMLSIDVPYETGRYLRALKPDAVVSVELGARTIAAARYRRQNPESRLLISTFITPHTEQPRGWLRRQLRRRLIDIADGITYNGPLCRQYLEDMGASPSKLFHFPYAANDLTTFNGPVQRDEDEARGRLLCVGQLIERKNVVALANQLCDYSAQHPTRRIELSLVGVGPLEQELREIATPPNLDLNLLGYVPPEDLPLLMKSHGAAISATLADEWLITVNESLHAGLPFIGSIYAQAVTTLVEDGINGWRFDPLQPASLTEALDAYFEASPQTIAQMRHNARQSVADKTPQWAAQGLLTALDHVLKMTDR